MSDENKSVEGTGSSTGGSDDNKASALKAYEKISASSRALGLDRDIGVLVEHGKANFNFEKESPTNYYVKLSDGQNKEKVVWGVDLQRAVNEAKAQKGDLVRLQRDGQRAVTVDEPVKDAAGNIVSYEKKEAMRNAWTVSHPEVTKDMLTEKSKDKSANHEASAERERSASSTDASTKPAPVKSLSDQAKDALRNAKRAEVSENHELAEKHRSKALALAFESGKQGEDSKRFDPKKHPELLQSHARGVEVVEVRSRVAQLRESEQRRKEEGPRVDQIVDRSGESAAPTVNGSAKLAKPLRNSAEKDLEFAGKPALVDGDKEKELRSKILAQINRDFRGVGGRYYKSDARGHDQLAFQDTGSKLVTQENDQKVAFAVAAMAQAKGWNEIKVSGHPDFRRNVWLEAKSRGLEVKGHTPNDHDLAALKERMDAKQRLEKPPVSERQERQGGVVEPVLKAVAEAVVKDRVSNPATQQLILGRIAERQEGKKFSVPIYDLKAPPKEQREVEKSQSRAPTMERTR